jgi:transcriptional regulator with XRE-family HTH domain
MAKLFRQIDTCYMSRPAISQEQKTREGAFLSARLEARQLLEEDLTVDSLADECGVSQGLVSQWITGRTAIPDKTMMWLGGRLGFDPFEVRPSLTDYLFMPLKNSDRRADLIRILSALGRCDDSKYQTALGVLAALFPDADLRRQ